MNDADRPTSSALPSATPTVHDEPGISSPVAISDMEPGTDVDNLKSRNEKAVKTTQDDRDSSRSTDDGVLVVNWEGPDDPQNPQKYVMHLYP